MDDLHAKAVGAEDEEEAQQLILRDVISGAGRAHPRRHTSTIKAFLSDSLSMVLIATSLPFHLALQTTPKAPLPTT